MTPLSASYIKRARWEQWGGLVERGRPDTLVLLRLFPKTTASRSPGPGPITKRDWKPVAKKFLEGRDVILHTDGAKAYTMKIKGVLHDNVEHKEEDDSEWQAGLGESKVHQSVDAPTAKWQGFESQGLFEICTQEGGFHYLGPQSPSCPVDILAQDPEYVVSHWAHVERAACLRFWWQLRARGEKSNLFRVMALKSDKGSNSMGHFMCLLVWLVYQYRRLTVYIINNSGKDYIKTNFQCQLGLHGRLQHPMPHPSTYYRHIQMSYTVLCCKSSY